MKMCDSFVKIFTFIISLFCCMLFLSMLTGCNNSSYEQQQQLMTQQNQLMQQQQLMTKELEQLEEQIQELKDYCDYLESEVSYIHEILN